jgi:large subunit ribosomal protein L24
MNKIRKGDNVIVLTGRDKGKRGDVVAIDGEAILVGGINQVKKHVRPNPMQNQPGGIVTKEMPIHISNVALFNSKTGKVDSVRIEIRDGKRVRVFKSSGEAVGA